jgi:uncharacterized protein (TIGR00251 family)
MAEKPSDSTRNPAVAPAPGARIGVHAIPKSKENAIEGFETDASGQVWLRVRIRVAPADGKANKELLKFLGKQWGVAPSCLAITSGGSSRYKIVRRIQ